MNWDHVQGNWQEIKGRVREQWGKLTDSDLETIGGKKDQLVGVLKQRYGLERDKAQAAIDSWLGNLQDKIAGRNEPPKS